MRDLVLPNQKLLLDTIGHSDLPQWERLTSTDGLQDGQAFRAEISDEHYVARGWYEVL